MDKGNGYINLLFEIFGITGWDKYGKEKLISTKYARKMKHWWWGIKRKPEYYKS